MINWLSSWAEGIVFSIIIISVIEMILPEGKNKKYIKTVLAMFLLFTILSPIIKKLINNDIELNYSFAEELKTETNYKNTYNNYEETTNKKIEELFEENLKKELINTIKEEGFIVNSIIIEIEKEDEKKYGLLKKVELEISYKEEVNKIEEINIDISNKNTIKKEVSFEEEEKLKKCIKEKYGIDKNYILIKKGKT